MSDSCAVNPQTMNESPVCWGAGQIAKAIGLTERSTYHRLQRGQIVCAKKIGGKWMAGRAALHREFGIGGE
jgi:hypothetical protein